MTTATPLHGARVWLVADPNGDATGWQNEVARALRDIGAASVEAVGVQGMIGLTARSILESGADLVQRAVRFVLPGQQQGHFPDAMARTRPDLIVCAELGALNTLDTVRNTIRLRTTLVGLLNAWELPLDADRAVADAFVAPDPELLARLRRPNQADLALRVAPPAVGAGFGRALDRMAVRADFGFVPGEFVYVVDAANLTTPAIDALIYQISLSRGAAVPLFHHGRNRDAADALRNAARAHRMPARMFGWVASLEEYLLAADLIVVPAHSELLAPSTALGRPLLAFDAALQASRPARDGALVVLPDLAALGDMLGRIVAGGIAPSHAQSAAAYAIPDGARHVAAAIAQIWRDRDRLATAATPGSYAANQADSGPGASPVSSPFETIGAGPATADDAELTRVAARDRLALLIREERRLESDQASLVRERDRWMQRQQLASEANAADLVALAESNLRDLSARIAMLQERLARIQDEKQTVRQRAAASARPSGRPEMATPAGRAGAEDRFRELERNSQLNRLREPTPSDPPKEPHTP